MKIEVKQAGLSLPQDIVPIDRHPGAQPGFF